MINEWWRLWNLCLNWCAWIMLKLVNCSRDWCDPWVTCLDCLDSSKMIFYAPPPPFEKRGILFCNCLSVCRLVSRLVCRPNVVHSISFDPFIWSIPNLVQGLPSMSKWSLLIFRSHVQRSRSHHSFEPTVLSAQYLLTPSLDQYQTWCRGCAQ